MGKKCVKCGKVFKRILGTVSDRQWNTRTYCSVRCARLGDKRSDATKKKLSRIVKARGWKGNKHPCWKGGRWKHGSGYVCLQVGKKQMLEHRYIMEQTLGRKLMSEERVHHINGNKSDNRIENLLLLPNESAHWYLHFKVIK